jgi:L-amino acid N-acyltransferase
MSENVKIRAATLDDLGYITEIYNDAVLRTVATFDTAPKTVEEQGAWFSSHDTNHPVLVAAKNGCVEGWASLSKYSDRCAYSGTAEVSLYVKEECRGRGIGRKLLRAVVARGEAAGLHTIIARIVEGNKPSISLFESEGFDHVGLMKEVGCKFGKFLNVDIMQRVFNSCYGQAQTR